MKELYFVLLPLVCAGAIGCGSVNIPINALNFGGNKYPSVGGSGITSETNIGVGNKAAARDPYFDTRTNANVSIPK